MRSLDHPPFRRRIRFALGLAQMTGVTLALVLLVSEGPTNVTLFAAVLTTLLTATSLLILGGHNQR